MSCGILFFPGPWPPRDPLSLLLIYTGVTQQQQQCIARAVSMPAPPACNAAVQLPIIPTAPSPARCPTCCHVVQAIQFIIAEAVKAPGPGEHIPPELAVRLPTLQVHRILSTELVVVQPGGQLLQQHRGQAHFLEVWDNILCRRLLQGMQPAWGE